MIKQKDILSCLPLLASVLGQKYGVQVRIGGTDACTNGKTITLPNLPLDCGQEMLALVRGYIDHESAHIRFTDFAALAEAKLDKVTFNLANALEDWRIEKRFSEIYPGSKGNLNWLARHFFAETGNDTTRAEEQSPALAALNYVLLTVRAWEVSEIQPARLRIRKVLEEVFPQLADQLDSVLSEVQQKCPDTKAAINYARRLSLCLQQWQQPQNNNSTPEISGSSESPGASKSGSEEDTTQHLNRSAKQTEKNKEAKRQLKELFTSESLSLPMALGEQIEARLKGQGNPYESSNLHVATVGTYAPAPLPPQELTEALRSSNALRQRLEGLLQSHRLRRCAAGRHGTLLTRNLYRLSTGNPKIFQREEVQKGINTAVHILLDCSGSMSDRMELTRQSCFSAAYTLDKMRDVNLAVTIFPTMSRDTVFPLLKHGGHLINNFGITAQGSTPLGPALWWVLQQLAQQPEDRKMILVISDGQPNDDRAAREAIQQIEKLGIEIYGIGIKLPSIKNLLPGKSEVIFSLRDLAPSLFGLLQHTLI